MSNEKLAKVTIHRGKTQYATNDYDRDGRRIFKHKSLCGSTALELGTNFDRFGKKLERNVAYSDKETNCKQCLEKMVIIKNDELADIVKRYNEAV